ncbi:hypothetical protein WJX73_009266 [Symbiochloris irregularis]|uniref:Ubiquitin carboxyl-terminal hydrolase n=1 Tax=Symbiochloris irregularis TaxID=706552 RepID=A0AAW1NNC8_9CHLO
MGKRWVPLESNPEVINEFTQKLGLDTSKYSFCDVFGLDPELLAMIPQPCLALVLLFPITEATEAAKDKQEKELQGRDLKQPAGLFYMKQTIGNACGTIGVLHALGNHQQQLKFGEGSFLTTFMQDTAAMSPAERGAFLENPPSGGPDIDSAHAEAAQGGSTATPPAEANTNLHFVCLTYSDNRLFELDGRKQTPIDHGATSADSFLSDAARVVQEFIAASDSHNFNVIALTATPGGG